MKLPYFPGCSLKTSASGFESSALAVAKALGIEMVELPRWNCCGAVFSLTSDDLIHHIAPIRNLVRVQEMNKKGLVKDEYRLVTLCSMCYNTLKRSNLFVKESPERLEKINSFMDREEDYMGKVEIIHYLQLLREIGLDNIQRKVKIPLKGLKVAPYYGCMLLRPREVGIDDPEEPRAMQEILETMDIKVTDNPYNTRCCGSYQTVNNKHAVAALTFDIVNHAMERGAEALAVSCPLCAFNLDDRQEEVLELHPDFERVPVFYFTQLMALALDLGEESCQFQLNHIDPMPLLRKRGILKH